MRNRSSFTKMPIWAAAAFFCGFSPAEDLDAALEAQKQRAPRRTYSERAVLDRSQEMDVPRPVSREDRLLENQMQAMEARLDSQARVNRGQPAPVLHSAPAPQSDTPRNWLTPAMLDDAASVSLQDKEEEFSFSGIRSEREVLERSSRSRDSRPVFEQPESDPSRQRPSAELRELDRLRLFEADPQLRRSRETGMMPRSFSPSSALKKNDSPGFSAPSRRGAVRERDTETRFSPFSPEAGRAGPSSPAGTSFSRPAERSSFQNPVDFSSRTETEPEAPRRPIDIMRRSSPMYDRDPFTKDVMPRKRTSIWE